MEQATASLRRETVHFPDLSAKLESLDRHAHAIGRYADLRRARRTDAKASKSILAVKVLRAGSSTNPRFAEVLQEKLVFQGDRWAQLKDPNVAVVFGVTYDFGRLPGIVMEYYDSSISTQLSNNVVEDVDKLKWVKQIASGLKFLHSRNPPLLHGDLRASNVFLNKSGKCVIADHGVASLTIGPEFTSMSSSASCRWMAPELMDSQPIDPNHSGPRFTKQSDVFSFAMTAVEIFSGQIPFAEKQNDTAVILLILNDKRPPLPPFVESNLTLSTLIQACWAKDPESRPSLLDICWQLGATSYFSYFLENIRVR